MLKATPAAEHGSSAPSRPQPSARGAGRQEEPPTGSRGGCPPLVWGRSAGFGASPRQPPGWKAEIVSPPALVPRPGQAWEKPSERPGWQQMHSLCLQVFCETEPVSYPRLRSVCLHHLKFRGWSFFLGEMETIRQVVFPGSRKASFSFNNLYSLVTLQTSHRSPCSCS